MEDIPSDFTMKKIINILTLFGSSTEQMKCQEQYNSVTVPESLLSLGISPFKNQTSQYTSSGKKKCYNSLKSRTHRRCLGGMLL